MTKPNISQERMRQELAARVYHDRTIKAESAAILGVTALFLAYAGGLVYLVIAAAVA